VNTFRSCYDLVSDRKKWLQARHSHDVLPAETPRMNEIGRKVLHVDWHNHRDIVTVASSHSVYVFENKVEKSGGRPAEVKGYAFA